MERRPYFLLGDAFSTLLTAWLAGRVVQSLIPQTWPGLGGMIGGMAAGMVVALGVAFLLMPLFGAMEVMIPVMLAGMAAGMVVGMGPPMGWLAAADVTAWSLCSGATVLAGVYLANLALTGEKSHGS